MRGREFYWKALYSFSKDQTEHDAFYEKAKVDISVLRAIEKKGIFISVEIRYAKDVLPTLGLPQKIIEGHELDFKN